jgi:hypothetical protein
MSWIREANVPETTPWKVASIIPSARESLVNHINSVFFGASPLTRVQEEAIGTVVAVANKCRF